MELKNTLNVHYEKALTDLIYKVPSEKYFVLGSLALLSYTQRNGYDRQINDIDIVMESTEAYKFSGHLKSLGFTQSTFINPRMPFNSKLMRFAEKKYLRFSKDGVNLEILATSITLKDNLVIFEMYPGIKAGLPIETLTESSYNGVEFHTVTKEALYVFKKIAANTLGRKLKDKEIQRCNDIEQLEKLVDMTSFREIAKKCRIYVLSIPIRIPSSLLN